jgi:hypothetical protein
MFTHEEEDENGPKPNPLPQSLRLIIRLVTQVVFYLATDINPKRKADPVNLEHA